MCEKHSWSLQFIFRSYNNNINDDHDDRFLQ
jgi:hypothetical protein